MKKEQFDESVNRALYQVSHNMEMNETLRYLEKDVNETERRAFTQDSVMVDGIDGGILLQLLQGSEDERQRRADVVGSVDEEHHLLLVELLVGAATIGTQRVEDQGTEQGEVNKIGRKRTVPRSTDGDDHNL